MSFSFTIKKNYGVLKSEGGYTIEVNSVSWNNGQPKFDIRQWHTKGGERKALRGITLTDGELKALYDVLKGVFDGKQQEVHGVLEQ